MDPSLLGLQGLREVFNVHPVFVHVPIALFPSALLLYSLGVVLKWRAACAAGRACLCLAAASTVVAVATGLLAQNTFPHNERIHHMMQTHNTLGIVLSLTSVPLVMWSFLHAAQRPRGTYPFLALLAFGTAVALQNGDLEARMVFVEGAAVRPAVGVITGAPRRREDTTDHAGHAHDHGSAGEAGHQHAQ
jgi:uncharacterized membrane protein